MECIFNTVLLDLSATMTDSFEGRGLIRGGGLTGRFTVYWYVFQNRRRLPPSCQRFSSWWWNFSSSATSAHSSLSALSTWCPAVCSSGACPETSGTGRWSKQKTPAHQVKLYGNGTLFLYCNCTSLRLIALAYVLRNNAVLHTSVRVFSKLRGQGDVFKFSGPVSELELSKCRG